jgi:hypothetical protein
MSIELKQYYHENGLVTDWISVRWAERQLGRKLTDDEIYGMKPVTVTTQDGSKASLFIEKYPFQYFGPQEWQRGHE